MTSITKSATTELYGAYQGIQVVYGYLPGGGYGVLYSDTYNTMRMYGQESYEKTGEVRKKPKGFLPPTNYYVLWKSGDVRGPSHMYASGFNRSSSAVHTVQGSEDQGGYWGLGALSSFDERATVRAKSRFLDSLKGQNVNLSLAFAERQQTASLVSDTATTLAKGVTALRNGDLKGFKKLIGLPTKLTRGDRRVLKKARNGRWTPDKKAAGLFLQNRYGWVPLLSDIEGAAKQLAEKDLDDPKRYCQARKGSHSITSVEENPNHGVGTSWWGIPVALDVSINRSWRCFIRCDVYLDNPALQSAAQLGLLNAPAVLWDKLPWSFVADWLLPIGKYINAMDATVGWQFRAGSITRVTKEQWTVRVRGMPNGSGNWNAITASGVGKSSQGMLDRQVLSGFPVFTVSDLGHSIKNPLSTGHVMNAIALLTQAFR